MLKKFCLFILPWILLFVQNGCSSQIENLYKNTEFATGFDEELFAVMAPGMSAEEVLDTLGEPLFYVVFDGESSTEVPRIPGGHNDKVIWAYSRPKSGGSYLVREITTDGSSVKAVTLENYID